MDHGKNNVTIDMSTNFDVDEALDKLAHERFSMPPAVIAAFRQAAQVSALRLLSLVSDEEKFNRMSTNSKLKVMDMIFDRAYGKSETASTAAVAAYKTGQGDSADKGKHADQLDKIAERAALMAAKRQPARLEGAARSKGDSFDDGGTGSLMSMPHGIYPELSGRRSRGSAQSVSRRADTDAADASAVGAGDDDDYSDRAVTDVVSLASRRRRA